jgi:polygalacturonase
VIDSVIECVADESNTNINTATPTNGCSAAVSAGTYLSRVYTKGYTSLLAGDLKISATAAENNGTNSYALANEVVAEGPMWWDGELLQSAKIYNVTTATSINPPDAVSQHVGWDEARFPSFESNTTADAVLDCKAMGDGSTDDTAALQTCIDVHDNVFLPKGLYRISSTLILHPGSSLVGLSQVYAAHDCICILVGEGVGCGVGTGVSEVVGVSFWGSVGSNGMDCATIEATHVQQS